MAKTTLDKLKVLPPIAAAIAFSAALPSQLLAKDFVIKSQAELDKAVDTIREGEGDAHMITFDSSVSGEHLTLNSMRLYGEGSLVIDGAGAKNLELGMLEKNNYYGIRLDDDAALTLKNLSIVEGGNASYGYVVRARGDAQITISNTHISGASLGSSYESSGVIEAEGLTITDSSFSGLSGSSIISVDDYAYEGGDTEQTIKITNTSFSNNFANRIIDIENGYYGSDLNTVVISGVSFDDNEVSDIIQIDVKARSDGDKEIIASITNTSFTNNKVYSNVIDAESRASGIYSASLTLNLANITLANNVTDENAINVQADNSSEGDGSTSLSVNMAHATIVNNGAELDEDGEGYSGGFGFAVYAYNSSADTEVNIVNSIISGNTSVENRQRRARFEVKEEQPKVVEADFYSDIDVNVDNSIIGAEYLYSEEDESRIVGKHNLMGIMGDDLKLGELKLDAKTGTMYMPLLKGSPAINAGTDKQNADVAKILGVKADELIDQIGHKRTAGSAPDMGAVEKTNKKSSGGLFGSFGFGSLIAAFGLLGLRRKRK